MNFWDLFVDFTETVGNLPQLVQAIVCPALLLVAALLLAIFHKRGAYLPVAAGLGGAQLFLACCGGELKEALAFTGLYVVWAAALYALFPLFRKRERESSRGDELYEQFRVPLYEGEAEGEEEAEIGAEESGLRLAHAFELLERLQKCDLAASDRLEADALSHTLEAYRDRDLKESEMRALNDCLATVLKLTAKYKL